ncbi:hypothetical protein G5I_02387 [Acromyrmex echinatior]|uniref:Uncharacterized protein n=1 Tax=Acromyrmex echinatior TaxID=103372 RepID=F4WA67_ACREC|nr:hypothetical protein G5I_02387 [Acromyrmex echinatior]
MVMQKADAYRWNFSKESFMDYAAKKIKLFQPIQLEQRNIITKGHTKTDCWKEKQKENISSNIPSNNTATVEKIAKTENTSAKDNTTEASTDVACTDLNLDQTSFSLSSSYRSLLKTIRLKRLISEVIVNGVAKQFAIVAYDWLCLTFGLWPIPLLDWLTYVSGAEENYRDSFAKPMICTALAVIMAACVHAFSRNSLTREAYPKDICPSCLENTVMKHCSIEISWLSGMWILP